uniref:HAUS augmin-like complex subunit 6 N-terminal domain-containing protein n=1 Tax=Dicentrarchus labrax TaxID=13489 RepID=A0A8C4HZ55_DICLA
MANPALLQRKNGKYLWFALLGLGFQPDAAILSVAGKTNINIKHINLGPNMFDKPNKDAFYIVTHFLLEKLNPTRFNEAYRYCWPVLNHKADAEFRKVTCAWLREIMDETANAGSKVVASLFLSPGGPKFINLMLNLANHVMLQEIKTFTTDDSWVPEAAAMPASSLDMAVMRLSLINSRFLKAAVDQDRFLHEYQRRAQLLVKSVRDIRAEGAKYDELLKYVWLFFLIFGCLKVRSLWSTIDGMLSTTKEDQHAVESVLKGDVDQYVLDGTDRVLKIPRCLLERVEQLPHQLSSGNVYEAGQLNLLCVLELMNHALQLLREECCRVAHAPKPQLSPEHLQEKCQQMARVLQNLHLIRQKISKEGIPEVRSAIRELETEWDRKWMDTLKDTPLVFFLNEDPALGFLSPMAPLSFEPAADTSYRSSVFSQYPATLLGEQNLIYIVYIVLQHCSYAVTTTTPTEGRVKDLEGILGTLHGDPFSTRKQLPRTPESLIMDVKSSWRKALEEDKVEKIAQSAKFNDDTLLSPDAPSLSVFSGITPPVTSHSSLPVSQHEVLFKSSLLWDTLNTETLDSPSGTGSSAVHFSLDHETLPEMPSCDSLLSLDDDIKSEDEDELLLPSLKTDAKQSPLITARHYLGQIQQACNDGSFMGSRNRTPKCLLSDHAVSGLDRDWLKQPAKAVDASDKVFSLDLDTLETSSPPKKQEYSLPKLITFSPIDDMKC